jgi:uncharacterized membrane protein HdeD (DUF308 family)
MSGESSGQSDNHDNTYKEEQMADSSITGIEKQSVGWAIALSILLILAGFLAIVLPLAAGIGVAVVIAWLLVLGGVAHLAIAWHIRPTGGLIWQVLLGLLYFALAVYLLGWPVAGLASLTLILACYLYLKGILVLILAFRIRHIGGAGWLFFDGVIALILGSMIGLSWPSSSEWAIGTLIGISMLFAGFTRLPMAIAARRLEAKPA